MPRILRVEWLTHSTMLAGLKLIHRFVSDISYPSGAVPNTFPIQASVKHFPKLWWKSSVIIWQHSRLSIFPVTIPPRDLDMYPVWLNRGIVLRSNMVPRRLQWISQVFYSLLINLNGNNIESLSHSEYDKIITLADNQLSKQANICGSPCSCLRIKSKSKLCIPSDVIIIRLKYPALGQVVGLEIRISEISASHMRERGFQSQFQLPAHVYPGMKQVMTQLVKSLPPKRGCSLSSQTLTLTWPAQAVAGIWWHRPVNGSTFSVSVFIKIKQAEKPSWL